MPNLLKKNATHLENSTLATVCWNKPKTFFFAENKLQLLATICNDLKSFIQIHYRGYGIWNSKNAKWKWVILSQNHNMILCGCSLKNANRMRTHGDEGFSPASTTAEETELLDIGVPLFSPLIILCCMDSLLLLLVWVLLRLRLADMLLLELSTSKLFNDWGAHTVLRPLLAPFKFANSPWAPPLISMLLHVESIRWFGRIWTFLCSHRPLLFHLILFARPEFLVLL